MTLMKMLSDCTEQAIENIELENPFTMDCIYIFFSLFAYNYSHLEEISKLKAKELLQQERKNRQNASGGAMKDIMIHKVTENT